MKVKLLEYTPNPDRIVASSARLCYSPIGADELKEKMTDEQVEKLIDKIMASGHTSPLEHVSFTFAIEGVSRALSHQLVRHRIASYSQQSQRYVTEQETDFVIPASITCKDTYKRHLELAKEFYDLLIEQGVPKEDARYVLPNAITTKLVVTMNARSLLHFFNLRCCQRAQWEIRGLANKMLEIVKGVAPVIFKKAGATCVATGHCPEGSLKCKTAL